MMRYFAFGPVTGFLGYSTMKEIIFFKWSFCCFFVSNMTMLLGWMLCMSYLNLFILVIDRINPVISFMFCLCMSWLSWPGLCGCWNIPINQSIN